MRVRDFAAPGSVQRQKPRWSFDPALRWEPPAPRTANGAVSLRPFEPVERALRRLHKHLGDEDVYNEVRVRAHFVPKGQAARCKSARARRRREK